jgi:hypothetical protein
MNLHIIKFVQFGANPVIIDLKIYIATYVQHLTSIR